MTLIRATTFQHSGRMWKRHDASGYVDSRSRKDCCSRCDHMTMRGRNPFCEYHRIFVQKMGICESINQPKLDDKP